MLILKRRKKKCLLENFAKTSQMHLKNLCCTAESLNLLKILTMGILSAFLKVAWKNTISIKRRQTSSGIRIDLL